MEVRSEINKTYKTDLPYPVPVYSVVVNYREVQNPSGIAYILLELISNPSAVDGTVSDALNQFGIPNDLHHIFESEIERLISDGIIAFRFGTTIPGEIRLDEIDISDYVLTDIGRRMFTDGAIPTGKNRRIRCQIEYKAIAKEFSDAETSLGKFADSELSRDSVLYDRLLSSISESNIEEYITSKKAHYNIKKNEMIVDFTIENDDWLVSKRQRNLSVVFSLTGVAFTPDSSAEKEFFDDFYNLEIVKNVLSSTPDYNFAQGTNFVEIEYTKLGANDIIIPGDIQKRIDEPCGVFIASMSSPYERKLSAETSVRVVKAISDRMLSILGENVHFACLKDSGECVFYVPCKAAVPCSQFSDDSLIEMDLFAEYIASEDKKEKLYDALKDYAFIEKESLESGNLIAYIERHGSQMSNICREYLDFKISECEKSDEKIQAFLRMFNYVKGCSAAKAVTAEIADRLYREYIADVSIDNLGLKYQILKPLFKLVQSDDQRFIKEVYGLLHNVNSDDVSIFVTLENLGIDSNAILSQINVIEKYAEMVLCNTQNTSSKLGKKFDAVRYNLWKLNSMFGVESPMDFVSLEDELDYTQFLSIYAAFDKAYNGIKQYEIYGADAFSKIGDFHELYKPVAELVKIDRAAQSNVSNINKKLITGYIASYRFKDAVCNLVIKLQEILKIELSAKGILKSENLIDGAFDAGLIDKDERTKLHNLRKCRNDFEHPNDHTRIEPNTQMCEEWRDIVFSIGEGGKK